jgi:hypothetical protein
LLFRRRTGATVDVGGDKVPVNEETDAGMIGLRMCELADCNWFMQLLNSNLALSLLGVVIPIVEEVNGLKVLVLAVRDKLGVTGFSSTEIGIVKMSNLLDFSCCCCWFELLLVCFMLPMRNVLINDLNAGEELPAAEMVFGEAETTECDEDDVGMFML